MVKMRDLPGEIPVTRDTLVKKEIRCLHLVSSTPPFALQRLLVAFAFFDCFTIGFVARRTNTIGFTILNHLPPGVYFRLLPVSFIIIFNEVHHRLNRIIRQFALGVASSLILGEQSDISMPILALSLLPFHLPVTQSTICHAQ